MMRRFMPSCRDISEVIMTSELSDAPATKRWALRLHLLICRHCARLARQMNIIAQGLSRAVKKPLSPSDIKSAKERIIAQLRRIKP